MRKNRSPLLPVFISCFLSVVLAGVSQGETVAAPVFRFSIANEPASLDPLTATAADANYFLFNVMRGLYSYSNDEGLISEGAKECSWKSPEKLICTLSHDLWSDGSPVVADDYARSFHRLAGKSSKNSVIELFKNLKDPDTSGIRALDATHLAFEFKTPDPDFLFKLASSLLVPMKGDAYPTREKSETAVVNGPYKIASWTPGKRLRLEPNLKYRRGVKSRPPVEVLFVDDDETALNLYENHQLTFLRRLPTTLIAKSKDRKDFVQRPIARFDYIGFGTDLAKQPELREALMTSIDFAEMKRLLDARGTPGCPSLPRRLMKDEPCVHFDIKRAQAALSRVKTDVRALRLTLAFSNLGGDDVRKQAEWLQAQWKKNLGIRVDLEQSEQGLFLAHLRARPPAIFRKGMTLQTPTCLAALETFTTDGPENFVKFHDKSYDTVVSKLASPTVKDDERRRLCSEGLKLLLTQNRLVPLGEIHFTLLVRPEFRGWSLNEMNQLDLADLSYNP